MHLKKRPKEIEDFMSNMLNHRCFPEGNVLTSEQARKRLTKASKA